MRVKKRYLLVSLLTIVLTLSIVVSAVCVFAALSQQVSLNTTISVEAINAVWTDGNQSEVSQLDFPTYVAPGQSISPEGGLFVKNEGVVAYARFKPTVKLNDVESDLVQLTINTDWIYEESDGEKKVITQKVVEPQIEGAIITAKGAESAEVKTSIIQAVEAVTGLATHKIQVFEMN